MKTTSVYNDAMAIIDRSKQVQTQREITVLLDLSNKVDDTWDVRKLIDKLRDYRDDIDQEACIKKMLTRIISNAKTVAKIAEIREVIDKYFINKFQLWTSLDQKELVLVKDFLSHEHLFQEILETYWKTTVDEAKDLLFEKAKNFVTDLPLAKKLFSGCDSHRQEAITLALPFITSLSDIRFFNKYRLTIDQPNNELRQKELEIVNKIKNDVKDYSEAIVCSEIAIFPESKLGFLSLGADLANDYFSTYSILKRMPEDSELCEKTLQKLIPLCGSINQTAFIKDHFSAQVEKYGLGSVLDHREGQIQAKGENHGTK